MKRLVAIPLLLAVSLLLPSLASAAPTIPRTLQIIQAANPELPPEWSGVWDTTDSLYFCTGQLFASSTRLDTLCTGSDVEIDFSCTGTVSGSSWNLSCTQIDQEPPCTYTTQMTMTSTRNGDSFVSEANINTVTTGPSPDCDSPDFCLRIVTHGTRISAAPPAFCNTTPTKRATWGQLKSIYR